MFYVHTAAACEWLKHEQVSAALREQRTIVSPAEEHSVVP